jgi:hypothetical protein
MPIICIGVGYEPDIDPRNETSACCVVWVMMAKVCPTQFEAYSTLAPGIAFMFFFSGFWKTHAVPLNWHRRQGA